MPDYFSAPSRSRLDRSRAPFPEIREGSLPSAAKLGFQWGNSTVGRIWWNSGAPMEIRRQAGGFSPTACYDLLHPGHIRLLEQARTLGDVLILALNSDARRAADERTLAPR